MISNQLKDMDFVIPAGPKRNHGCASYYSLRRKCRRRVSIYAQTSLPYNDIVAKENRWMKWLADQ